MVDFVGFWKIVSPQYKTSANFFIVGWGRLVVWIFGITEHEKKMEIL